MQVQFTDFNNAAALIAGPCAPEWNDVHQTLTAMQLHLKPSDQNGLQGNAIFDPVGTNAHIATALTNAPRNWTPKVPIPPAFSAFGTDVDFEKNGTIVEVQFSNYPFLLNNTFRSELFFRNQLVLNQVATRMAIIVTKAQMFPSSQSTLYYEQAIAQLTALAQQGVFTIPVRLVGLFEPVGRVTATWTTYSAARTSRTVAAQNQRQLTITNGRAGRCRIA